MSNTTKEILLHRTNSGYTFLHQAANKKNILQAIKLLQQLELLNHDELENLLLQKTNRGYTVMHCLAMKANLKEIKCFEHFILKAFAEKDGNMEQHEATMDVEEEEENERTTA